MIDSNIRELIKYRAIRAIHYREIYASSIHILKFLLLQSMMYRRNFCIYCIFLSCIYIRISNVGNYMICIFIFNIHNWILWAQLKHSRINMIHD